MLYLSIVTLVVSNKLKFGTCEHSGHAVTVYLCAETLTIPGSWRVRWQLKFRWKFNLILQSFMSMKFLGRPRTLAACTGTTHAKWVCWGERQVLALFQVQWHRWYDGPIEICKKRLYYLESWWMLWQLWIVRQSLTDVQGATHSRYKYLGYFLS